MKPKDIPLKPTLSKHDQKTAENIGVDYINGLSYFQLSTKYGVSEGTLRRTLIRIYGETFMSKKLRKSKKDTPPEVPVKDQDISLEDKIKLLESELKKKEKKIQQMEYMVDVIGDYLGKDFGLPKKK